MSNRKVGVLSSLGLGFLAVVGGRILSDFPPAVYLGIVCIVLGSLWNLIAKRSAARGFEPRGAETSKTSPCCGCGPE